MNTARCIINGITSKWRTSRKQRGEDSTNDESAQTIEQKNDSPAGHVKWFERGVEHYNILQQFGEALAAFEKTLELDPCYVNAWNGKGEFCLVSSSALKKRSQPLKRAWNWIPIMSMPGTAKDFCFVNRLGFTSPANFYYTIY